MERRPLKTRNMAIMHSIAGLLARKRVSPNFISVLSIVFAIGAGTCLMLVESATAWWFGAAAFIQLRLLANLLDGMVAIEGGMSSKLGAFYNEVPDRIADAAILIGFGLAPDGSLLWGVTCTAMAVYVAYLRAFGASEGTGQVFLGPMAKPHRMFTVTVCALLMAFVPDFHERTGWNAVLICQWVVFYGSVLTALRRTHLIMKRIKNRD